MTNIKKLALAASIAGIGFATPANAAPYTAPTAQGDALVRLYTAIDLTNDSDLDFGVVIRDAGYTGGSKVLLSSAGVVDCSPVGLSCTGTPSVGQFTITGDSGSDMSVTIDAGADYAPNSSNTLTLRNGAASLDMELKFAGMTQDTGAGGINLNTFSMTGTGAAQTIALYGDLTVKASGVSSPNGTYRTTLTLTADYK